MWYIYIECKKSESKNWVFYVDYDAIQGVSALGYREGYKEVVETKTRHKKLSGLNKIAFTMNSYLDKIAFIQINAFEDPTKKEGKDSFHEAEMQVLKAINYAEDISPTNHFVYPVIVYDGRMFECNLVKNALKVSEITNIRYLSKGLPNEHIPILIDVITLDYFNKWLIRLERNISKPIIKDGIEEES